MWINGIRAEPREHGKMWTKGLGYGQQHQCPDLGRSASPLGGHWSADALPQIEDADYVPLWDEAAIDNVAMPRKRTSQQQRSAHSSIHLGCPHS